MEDIRKILEKYTQQEPQDFGEFGKERVYPISAVLKIVTEAVEPFKQAATCGGCQQYFDNCECEPLSYNPDKIPDLLIGLEFIEAQLHALEIDRGLQTARSIVISEIRSNIHQLLESVKIDK